MLKLLYFGIITYFVTKFLQWLFNYLNFLNNYSQMKGFPILPLLGNTHQLGKRNGNLQQQKT